MNVYKTKECAIFPQYATEGSACFDISAAFVTGEKIQAYNTVNRKVDILTKEIEGQPAFLLHPGQRALVPTGLIFDIPDRYVMKMYIRSSAATRKGLALSNGVGIIDSDYVEETHILLLNISDSLTRIVSGDRLAQCVIEPVNQVELIEVSQRPGQKTDRDGGIGSTGD
jgi:dUTP pyrophosphatase